MSNNKTEVVIERRFDITCDITKDWFSSYVKELAKLSGTSDGISCSANLRSDSDNRVNFGDRDTWAAYVLDNWRDVNETIYWNYADGPLRRASCNHRRKHILWGIAEQSADDVEKTLIALSDSLSLASSPVYPYRYRRSSLEFEIGSWRADRFAAGVLSIAKWLGSDPDVPEAFAKSFEGDVEKLTPFFDVSSFCAGVGTRVSLFGELVIQMQSQSIGVGIAVTSDHKRLRIRTTLPPAELDNLITPWPEELKLKQIKATDSGAGLGGAIPVPIESPWLKYGIPVLIALVTAASTAGFVGLKKAVWPSYSVKVTSPHLDKTGVARWKFETALIDWYLMPDEGSFRELRRGVAGTILIQGASQEGPPIQGTPPLLVKLSPGINTVVVEVPGAIPAEFEIDVDSQATPTK